MELIKRYRVVIAVVLPILILVLFRSFAAYHFKSDAVKWAEPSVAGSNIITSQQMASLTGKILLLNMDEERITANNVTVTTLNISADSILLKNNIKTIQKHKGALLLNSTDLAVSARIWMVLSQMGLSNIYILANESDNEVFKNKFRSDTLVRPEF